MDRFFDQGLSDGDTFKAWELFLHNVGVEGPSPTFVTDFVRQLQASGVIGQPIQNFVVDDIEEDTPDVSEEQHLPQVNDLMSGAILPSARKRLSGDAKARAEFNNDNSSTVCFDEWDQLVENMPYLLLSRDMLGHNWIFEEPRNILQLHEDLMITVKGLDIALNECEALQNGGVRDDDVMIAAILKRAGLPSLDNEGYIREVVYPEDLRPIIGPEDVSLYDGAYWDEIRVLMSSDGRSIDDDLDEHLEGQ